MNINEAVAAEKRMVIESYRLNLFSLRSRLEQALARLGSPTMPICDHDAHNMSATLHELALLAGRYEELARLDGFLAQEEAARITAEVGAKNS